MRIALSNNKHNSQYAETISDITPPHSHATRRLIIRHANSQTAITIDARLRHAIIDAAIGHYAPRITYAITPLLHITGVHFAITIAITNTSIE